MPLFLRTEAVSTASNTIPISFIPMLMVDQPAEATDQLSSQQQEKLRELTAQSWNLELVVSGVIMFAVLQVPDLLDAAFDYIQYNLLSQTEGLSGMLPKLATSMMKAGCYVLFIAFLLNFVMRAYWVALVGLLAVYPAGVQYDKLPFTTAYSRQRTEAYMGSLDRYILQLDRRCNIVFAVAFIFVFQLIVVALSYLLLLLLHAGLRPLIPTHYWQPVKITFFILLGIFMAVSLLLSIPSIRERPGMASFHYRFFAASRSVSWGLYKPFTFITNTFSSHIPRQKLLRTISMMAFAFMVLIIIEFFVDFSRQERRSSLLSRRHLFTARVDSLFINPGAYDNQLTEDGYTGEATIQADIIREPFVRLYIAYPKSLDVLLKKLAPEPTWNEELSLTERRNQFARWSNQQVNRLVRISVNDSLYQNPNLFFTERGTAHQRGWQTVLLPTNLKKGCNVVRISIQTDSSGNEEKLATIPFWYVPEN
jgi:hypothetical protein